MPFADYAGLPIDRPLTPQAWGEYIDLSNALIWKGTNELQQPPNQAKQVLSVPLSL